MATESNLESPQGVHTYRGRTLEEILPQIRDELGPDAIILREREGLVGGVGGFFAQRFVEVEARRGDGSEQPRGSGSSIDIYDEDDDELGFAPGFDDEPGQALLTAGEPGDGEDGLEISARRETAPEPQPFIPRELQRERIIPREPEAATPPPTRRFETDVFLERLRAASEMLPDDEEQGNAPQAAAPSAPLLPTEPEPVPEPEEPATETRPRRPPRSTPAERKPRTTQARRPRPAPRGKGVADAAEQPTPAPAPQPLDPWTVAMAALVAETEPDSPAPPRPAGAGQASPQTAHDPDEAQRQRPRSLRTGLPTERQPAPAPARARPAQTLFASPGPTSPASPPPASKPAPPVSPIPGASPIAPLEIRGRRDGVLRSVLSRLLGGRFGASTLPKASLPRPLDAAAAARIASELSSRGASPAWTAQLIGTAGAHGTPLSGGLEAATTAEIARRIVPGPVLPTTGAALAFIGAGGSGKTRCSAALASAYSRASTLGVTVIAIDNPSGARELKRLLDGDGVPVLSLSGERARQAVAAYRQDGFVIIDTPTTTPTDAAALEALGATLEPLELDATFVTLPATLGAQAARRALASFGRLDPSAVAITHADETDQLAVVVELAIANRIPLAYFHAGTDHRTAMTAVDAALLAQELLAA